MNTRTRHKTEAIVLRSLDYGESDRIMTFFTLDFGKLSGIAKGARKSRKRFPNALEPYSYAHILFSKKGRDTLSLIENSDMIDHHPAIRGNLEGTLVASYLLELMNEFTAEGKRSEETFSLLRDFLALINAGNATDALIRFFEIRLLKLSGFEPVLDRCISCQTAVDNGNIYRFNPRDGGIRCPLCISDMTASIPVSTGTIRTLLMEKEMDLERLRLLVLSDRAAEESHRILAPFIRHVLGKELKSLHVLQQVRRLCV